MNFSSYLMIFVELSEKATDYRHLERSLTIPIASP